MEQVAFHHQARPVSGAAGVHPLDDERAIKFNERDANRAIVLLQRSSIASINVCRGFDMRPVYGCRELNMRPSMDASISGCIHQWMHSSTSMAQSDCPALHVCAIAHLPMPLSISAVNGHHSLLVWLGTHLAWRWLIRLRRGLLRRLSLLDRARRVAILLLLLPVSLQQDRRLLLLRRITSLLLH